MTHCTFLPGGTRFWLVFRMWVRAFLMFFSFMLDSTAGGRNSARPHSFLQTNNSSSLRKVSQRHHHSRFASVKVGLTSQPSLTEEDRKQLGPCITVISLNCWWETLKWLLALIYKATYSMYFRETFWDCLVFMVKIYIWSAARWRAVSYFSSDPNLSNTTSLQLWRSQTEQEELMIMTSKIPAQWQQLCVCKAH